MVLSVEGNGSARPAEVLGHRHSCCKDFATLPFALPRGQLSRGPAVDHVAVVDGGEAVVIFVVLLAASLLLLGVITRIFFEPLTVEMLSQHTTVLEFVVGAPLMVRARLLQHLVEDASIRRASRFLSIHGGDEVVIGIFPVELPHFLLLFIFLEASTGGPIFIDGLLAFSSF